MVHLKRLTPARCMLSKLGYLPGTETKLFSLFIKCIYETTVQAIERRYSSTFWLLGLVLIIKIIMCGVSVMCSVSDSHSRTINTTAIIITNIICSSTNNTPQDPHTHRLGSCNRSPVINCTSMCPSIRMSVRMFVFFEELFLDVCWLATTRTK